MNTSPSTHAQAAAQIRAALKKAGIKASVRSDSFAGGTSVDIHLIDTDPATSKRAQEIAAPYQYGHFDGMTDCYEYSNKQSGLPQAKFVHTHVSLSPGMEQRVYDFIRGYFAGGELLPVHYTEAQSLNFQQEWVSTWVHRYFSDPDSPFWQAQRVAA